MTTQSEIRIASIATRRCAIGGAIERPLNMMAPINKPPAPLGVSQLKAFTGANKIAFAIALIQIAASIKPIANKYFGAVVRT